MPKKKLTEAEYLAIERDTEYRSEFYNGEMFAMAGPSTGIPRALSRPAALRGVSLWELIIDACREKCDVSSGRWGSNSDSELCCGVGV
jgi:hypothetical protein